MKIDPAGEKFRVRRYSTFFVDPCLATSRALQNFRAKQREALHDNNHDNTHRLYMKTNTQYIVRNTEHSLGHIEQLAIAGFSAASFNQEFSPSRRVSP